MSQIANNLFMFFLLASGLMLLIGCICAVIGLFSKVEATKNKFYSLAAKLLLAFVLSFVIGFGACVASF